MFLHYVSQLPKGLDGFNQMVEKVPDPMGRYFFNWYTGGGFFTKLVNLSNKNILAENVMNADSFLKRLKGLMFTKNLSSQSALLISPCSGIHTYFMNYSIDVLYLDNDNKVIAVDESMRPGRIGKYRKGSVMVVELSAGSIQRTETKVGQAVQFI